MEPIFRTAAVILALTVPCSSARLGAPAQRAFENYAASVEARLNQQHSSPDTYLVTLNVAATDRADLDGQLRGGALHMEPVNGGTQEVSGGLLHHWRGAAFVAGARAGGKLGVLGGHKQLSPHFTPRGVSA